MPARKKGKMKSDSPHIKVINCERALTVKHAAKYKEDILEALKENDTVWINMAHATKLDSAFVQVLYAAKREAVAEKKKLFISGEIPEYLHNALVAGGFIPDETEIDINKALIDFPAEGEE